MQLPWHARERTAWLVLLLFACIHGLVTFPNHWLFRTNALDLGLYTHALWHYAHLGIHDSTLFLDQSQPILADHFDLYLPLLSPLIYVFGSWTLLIVQWCAVLWGAWGVRAFLLARQVNASVALAGMVVFLPFFGLFAALAYDYHSNVVAAMVLPWFLLALERRRAWLCLLLFMLILIAKENMGLWAGPAALILAFDPAYADQRRKWLLGLGALGLTWSVLVIGFVMPALAADAGYHHFDYVVLLGDSLRDLPSALLSRPIGLLQAFFLDHRGATDGTAIKIEFWWMLCCAGGWAFVTAPRWGSMALPVLAQKMWHDDPGKWSVVAQYAVELAPLVAIAASLTIARVARPDIRKVLMLAASFGAVLVCVRFLDATVVYQDRSRSRIYKAEHYTRGFDTDEVRSVLATIEDNAAISAQSVLVPHLALRDEVHQFPIIGQARYIALVPTDSPYPLSAASYAADVEALRRSGSWCVRHDTRSIMLLELCAPQGH